MHKVGLQTATTHTKKKPLASSARRYLFMFTAGQPVSAPVWKMDNQWSPLTFHGVYSFAGANNNHLAGFPTSVSIVYSHVWIGLNHRVD